MAAFDVVVLGGGTAGVHVATEVAGGGKTVALVEAGLIGGESAYLACLPSNSLLLSASPRRALGRRGGPAGRGDRRPGRLGRRAAAEPRGRAGDPRHRPDHRPGHGRGDPRPGRPRRRRSRQQAAAGGTASGTTTLTYSDLVIATGCEPVAPPIEGLSDIPAWTTAQSLSSPDLPRRLIVLGGGPAGCELTQIYASFGSQVTLVEAEPRLLPGEPAFAGEILAAALRRAGAEIRLGSRATKAERTADGLTLALEDGTRIDAARLLLASGRRPRLGGLGLDVLGLEVTPGMALPTTTRCEVAGTGGPGLGGRGRHRDHAHPRQPLPGRRGRGEHPRPAPRGRLQRDPAVRVHHALGVRGRRHPGRANRGAGGGDGDGQDADHAQARTRAARTTGRTRTTARATAAGRAGCSGSRGRRRRRLPGGVRGGRGGGGGARTQGGTGPRAAPRLRAAVRGWSRPGPGWATPPGGTWARTISVASSSTRTPGRECWPARSRWGRTRPAGWARLRSPSGPRFPSRSSPTWCMPSPPTGKHWRQRSGNWREPGAARHVPTSRKRGPER